MHDPISNISLHHHTHHTHAHPQHLHTHHTILGVYAQEYQRIHRLGYIRTHALDSPTCVEEVVCSTSVESVTEEIRENKLSEVSLDVRRHTVRQRRLVGKQAGSPESKWRAVILVDHFGDLGV